MSLTGLNHIWDMYSMWQQARGINATTRSACDRLIHHKTFYYWMMLPSAGIIGLLMFFVTRVRLWPNCLKGRFAVLVPMNFLDDKGYRLSYCAVFGLTASVCIKMIQQDYPVPIIGPAFLKVIVKIGTMMLYGFAFYPILAGLTMNTILSLALITFYVWAFFIVNMMHATDCADDWDWEFYMDQVFLYAFPELACSLFLSILVPLRFVQVVIKKVRKQDKTEAQQFWEDSYQAKYVREIFLRQPTWIDDDKPKPKLKERLCNKVKSMTYTRVTGFKYTPRIMATFTGGFVLLYLVAVQFGQFIIVHVDSIIHPIDRLVDQHPMTLDEVYTNRTFLKNAHASLFAVSHLAHAIKVDIAIAIFLAIVNGVVQIALAIRAYRSGILAAWRGDYSNVGKRRGYPSLMVGFVRYSGYQVAYIFWAFMLQFGFLFIVLLVITVVIFMIFFWQIAWILGKILNFWPVIVFSLLINIGSKIAAKYAFLQDKGKTFAMENRRLLFCVMYFLFFYNVFVGLFSCLLRMVKALVFGLLFLSRLDSSTLPKKFEKMDPGFKAWIGLIHVENAHTNPILMTFVNMVKDEIEKNREKLEEESGKVAYYKANDSEVEGGELNGVIDAKNQKMLEEKEAEKKAMQRRKAMKAQWFLAYTLINNFTLRATRKHFMDAEKEKLQRRFKKKKDEEVAEDDVAVVVDDALA